MVLKKLSITQQKQTYTSKLKDTVTQNKHYKTKATFDPSSKTSGLETVLSVFYEFYELVSLYNNALLYNYLQVSLRVYTA